MKAAILKLLKSIDHDSQQRQRVLFNPVALLSELGLTVVDVDLPKKGIQAPAHRP
jgi:hypothetical protein